MNAGSVQEDQLRPGVYEAGGRSAWCNSRHSVPQRTRIEVPLSRSNRMVVQWHQGLPTRPLGTHSCQRESRSLNDQLGIMGAGQRKE